MKLCCRMRRPGRTLPLAVAVLSLSLFISAARADRLDEVTREGRAALAVAACAYSPQQAPPLYPDQPDFRPEAAPDYLQTYQPGELYEAPIQTGGFRLTFTIVQFSDEKVATQKFAEWNQEGEPVDRPEIGGPVFLRESGSERQGYQAWAARTQLGPWHFEVSAATSNMAPTQKVEGEKAIWAHFPKLLENAQRFRLLPYQLILEYFPGRGQPAIRLAPNQPFQLSLEGWGETRATFRVYVLDPRGQLVNHVRYKVRLEGPLAQFAQVDRDGSRSPGTEQVFEDASDPVLVRWIFPEITDAAFGAALERGSAGGADVSLDVEARFTPKTAPPA